MRALINFLVALFVFAGSTSSFAQERPHGPRVGYLGIGRAAPPPAPELTVREAVDKLLFPGQPTSRVQERQQMDRSRPSEELLIEAQKRVSSDSLLRD